MPSMAATSQSAHAKKMEWTLRDQVAECRAKIQLKERDRKCFVASSQAEAKRNEDFILTLRQENDMIRKLLASTVNNDSTLLYNVLQHRRRNCLELQRKSALDSIDILDAKRLDEVNKLNDLRNERFNKEKIIEKLRSEYEILQKIPETDDVPESTMQELRRIENSLDKAKMKYSMAKNIHVHYKEIYETLLMEIKSCPAKLNEIERTIAAKNEELEQLKKTNAFAQEAKFIAKKELNECEEEAFVNKRERDHQLTTARKEVEKRKEIVKKIEGRINRNALLASESYDHKEVSQKAEERERQQKILTYEDGFNQIKTATDVTDINDAVNRVMNQSITGEHLERQKKEMEVQKIRLQKDIEKITKEFHEMKYSGDAKMSSGQRNLEEVQNRFNCLKEREIQTEKEIESTGDVLVAVKTGVANLHEKLSPIRLKPFGRNYVTFDVLTDMDTCIDKIDVLFKELELQGPKNEEIHEKMNCPEFYSFLEGNLPSVNVRVDMQTAEQDFVDESYYDHKEPDHEETLTREDIKSRSLKITEKLKQPAKAPPRKK